MLSPDQRQTGLNLNSSAEDQRLSSRRPESTGLLGTPSSAYRHYPSFDFVTLRCQFTMIYNAAALLRLVELPGYDPGASSLQD